MSRPWLSVVVPTFDGAPFVGAALGSVAGEDDDGIEVVVVDDGSTDGTVDVVRGFDDRLRLRVDASRRRGGWTATTNAGLELASADRVTFLHQDDRWLPGRARAVRDLVERHPDAALHVHAARFVAPDGTDLGAWSLPLPRGADRVPGALAAERLLVQNWLCVDAPVFRRDDALVAGGLDERLWYTADWDLWLRLAATGDVAYDTRALVGFCVHASSQTSTRSADTAELRRQLEAVLERHQPVSCDVAVRRAARASVEVNVALAALSHGDRRGAGSLARALVALGPRGGGRLVRDARLGERIGARLRARHHDRRT